MLADSAISSEAGGSLWSTALHIVVVQEKMGRFDEDA
jgi:hypothetical protein